MEQQSNKPGIRKHLTYLWLLIGAVLYVFTVGNHIIPAAVWIAPVFIIRFPRSQSVVMGSLIILIVTLITQAVAYLGTFPVSRTPGLIFYIAGIVTGIFIVIPYIADRIIIKRYNGIFATLVFPVCMLCVLYLYSQIPFFGSSFIGFFHYGLSSSQKILSIFGFNSLVFLILWFASLINWLWEHEFQWIDIKKPAVIYLAIILAVLIFGSVKYTICPEPNSKFVFNTKSEYWPTKDWKTSTAEMQGMDSSLLAEMFKKINNDKSKVLTLVVVRNGYIVAEAAA
jgi:apolipoprotein N-acyltransferase